jgi:hypothetical protein
MMMYYGTISIMVVLILNPFITAVVTIHIHVVALPSQGQLWLFLFRLL